MELTAFYNKIEKHVELEGIGIDTPETDKPCVVVKQINSGLTTRLPVAAIEKAPWDLIEDILLGNREPIALQHMTRVVGYYSRIDNWNKSKLGELKDRHKGNYALAEASS